ncbi:hypothetical protein AB1Z15_000508 [Vibrio parahaemolyticus]
MILWLFSVAPNSHGRLAFATGQEGVFLNSWLSRDEPRAESKLIDSPCIEIDWFDSTLIAGLEESVVRCDFEKIPNKNDMYDEEFEAALRRIKLSRPKTITQEDTIRSWVAGDKIYRIKNNGELEVSALENENGRNVKIHLSDLALSEFAVNRAKTASFGTILETDQDLYILNSKSFEQVSDDFVSWRVYPRARNYANHLHIVKDDYLKISVINPECDDSLALDIRSFGKNYS